MKANRISSLVCAIGISFAGAALAQETEPPVAVNTDGMPLHVAARVKQKAAQGITALRRYVWITRAINELDLRSIVVAVPSRR